MTVDTWIWCAWAAMFLGVEIPAIVNHIQGDTLSEQVWHYLTHPQQGLHATVGTWLGRAGVAALLVWLIGHFCFGIWTT